MLNVKQFIERNHLSHSQFAAQLGVQRSYVGKIISGDRHPSVHLLRKIHEVTGIPVKALLYECT
jgi:transcriptional regulator with XRE-family HTH domain